MKPSTLTFLLFFLLLSGQTVAQSFFVLKNGETVLYKKYKIINKDYSVEISKPAPAKIPIKDIDYLVDKNGEISYIKFKLNKEQSVKIHGIGEYLNPDFEEMGKFVEGKISLYKYKERHTSTGAAVPGQFGAGGQTYSISYFFLEKDDTFAQIFNPELLENKKKDNRETISKFFEDDPEIHQRLNSKDFKANMENVLDLFRLYNIRQYDQSSIELPEDEAKVIFYRGYANQDKELVAEIEIGEHKISLSDMNYRMVKLPAGVPIKICINNGTKTVCDLVSASTHLIKPYEVLLKKSGAIEVKLVSTKQYDKYIHVLNQSY